MLDCFQMDHMPCENYHILAMLNLYGISDFNDSQNCSNNSELDAGPDIGDEDFQFNIQDISQAGNQFYAFFSPIILIIGFVGNAISLKVRIR